jgi:UDP-galactose transporter B1
MGVRSTGNRKLEWDELMIVSKPFPSTHPHPTSLTESKFPSALFLNFAQAIASCLSAITYLGVQSCQNGTLGREGWKGVLGINQLLGGDEIVKEKTLNGTAHSVQNGHAATTTIKTTANTDTKTTTKTLREKLPFLLLQVSIFQTLAGPIGFSALRHISYPTMVLGKVSFPHIFFFHYHYVLVGYRCFRLALGVSLQERNLEIK